MLDDREWIEKFKIQELIYRYTDGVNRGDLEAIRRAYADDAVWESPVLGERHESADAFCEYFRVGASSAELLVQTASAPVVTLVGDDTATATTTIFEFCRGTTAQDGAFGPAGSKLNFMDFGIYYDDVAHSDGEWKFTHRLFVPIYLQPDVVIGDVPVARSSLMRPTAQ